MIFFLKKLNRYKLQVKNYKLKRGMTYVELIVVLGIFAVLSAIAIYNYTSFQEKIDIKNLASDIALQLVTAQKAALGGALQNSGISFTGKPTYGVYFNLTTNKSFIYFADTNNNYLLDGTNCSGECLTNLVITKNNYISRIDTYVGASPTSIAGPVAVSFRRPNSGAVIYNGGALLQNFDYLQIAISSASGKSLSYIKVYPSGRIQIN